MKKTLLIFAALMLCVNLDISARERSQAAKNEFKRAYPCPANGNDFGSCPGYIIDHITPLACGGADESSNMQWQTAAASKEKDGWERKGCGAKAQQSTSGSHGAGDAPGGYTRGPRGGCYTFSASGKKRYVDRSLCN